MMKITDKKLIEGVVIAIYEGQCPSYKFGCTKKQLVALTEALAATRAFELTLLDESASMIKISEALQVKHVYAKRFEQAFSQIWPL
jgi:hypothetical protein